MRKLIFVLVAFTQLNALAQNPEVDTILWDTKSVSPSNPIAGEVYMDSNYDLYKYDGVSWSIIGGGGGGTVTVDNALSEFSTNPVENNVLKSEFELVEAFSSSSITNIFEQSLSLAVSLRTQNSTTQYSSASEIVYDRDLIVAEIGGTPYIILSNFELSESSIGSILSTPGNYVHIGGFYPNSNQIPGKPYTFFSDAYEGIINTTPVGLTGLDVNYTALQITNSSFFIKPNLDLTGASDSFMLISLVRPSKRVPVVGLSTISSPVLGDIIIDSEETNKLKYYDGVNWLEISTTID